MESETISKFGALFSVGSGGSGQLLTGNLDDYIKFQPTNPSQETTNFINNVNTIVLGGTLGLGLTSQGTLYQWGENFKETEENITIEPTIISLSLKVLKVACGWAHNVCLAEGNQVFVWGEGKFGQLGLGKDQLRNISNPTLLLKSHKEILGVVGGFRQTYLLTAENKILCCGSNKFFELGQETKESVVASPIQLNLSGITAELQKLRCGQRHVVVLDEKGNLYGWGSNKYGQLGLKNEEEKVKGALRIDELSEVSDFACGWSHTIVLRKGSVLIAGRGNFGQQGNGKLVNNFGFEKVEFPDKVEVKKVVSGSETCHVITNDDKIYTWGWNEHGNLGVGDKVDRLTPVKLNIPPQGKDPEIICGGAALILGFKNAFFEGSFKGRESE